MKFKNWVVVLTSVCASIALAAAVALAESATVAVRELNIRTGPGTDYEVRGMLRQGERVEVTEREGDWAFVSGGQGRSGWVFADDLTPERGSGFNTEPDQSNAIYEGSGSGTIDNSRYDGEGFVSLSTSTSRRARINVASRNENVRPFEVTYFGRLIDRAEGRMGMEIEISEFESSELSEPVTNVNGICAIEVSGTLVTRLSCTLNDSRIDHGRTVFSRR